MNGLRNRLIVVFALATLVPLGLTAWAMTRLLQTSLAFAPTKELSAVSDALENAGRELYREARENLRHEAQRHPELGKRLAPAQAQQFWDSGEQEQFEFDGDGGTRLNYYVRAEKDIVRFSRDLHVGMSTIATQLRDARSIASEVSSRDLGRGFQGALIVVTLSVWIASLGALTYVAYRARDRLVEVTRMASWQTIGRKMAHEVKNSLTPIRLTMEEIASRGPECDATFLGQASQIVIDEVAALERRVRAFSELAAEPPVQLTEFDLGELIEERVTFLKPLHAGVEYQVDRSDGAKCRADAGLIRGALTNLLENAAHAAGSGGTVLAMVVSHGGAVRAEVHDSGPGVSAEARATLFEPSISYKKGGMGLGLSIARRGALLCGGDLRLVPGKLGGAGFCLELKA